MVYYPGSIVFVSSFQGDRTQVMEKRFTEFVLVAENAEAVLGAKVDTAREGSYQLLGDVLTRFSDHCTNTGWCLLVFEFGSGLVPPQCST